MRYIKQSFEEIKKSEFYTHVAKIAHNCYQVDKSSDDALFIKRLIKNKHYAMIEHYNFVLRIDESLYSKLIEFNNPFIILAHDASSYYVRFSLRPLLELKDSNALVSPLYELGASLNPEIKELLDIKEDSKYELLDEEGIDRLPYEIYLKMKTISLKIITDRGVSHELVRHRVASYAQESTRYCNYQKDKFGNELTFIEPLDYEKFKDSYDEIFSHIESKYMDLLNNGSSPEMARSILPNKLKTSIIMTASIEEYLKVFILRCDSHAHPDMRDIMLPIREYFIKEGYIHE